MFAHNLHGVFVTSSRGTIAIQAELKDFTLRYMYVYTRCFSSGNKLYSG